METNLGHWTKHFDIAWTLHRTDYTHSQRYKFCRLDNIHCGSLVMFSNIRSNDLVWNSQMWSHCSNLCMWHKTFDLDNMQCYLEKVIKLNKIKKYIHSWFKLKVLHISKFFSTEISLKLHLLCFAVTNIKYKSSNTYISAVCHNFHIKYHSFYVIHEYALCTQMCTDIPWKIKKSHWNLTYICI